MPEDGISTAMGRMTRGTKAGQLDKADRRVWALPPRMAGLALGRAQGADQHWSDGTGRGGPTVGPAGLNKKPGFQLAPQQS